MPVPSTVRVPNPYASPPELDTDGDRSFFRASFEVGKQERHVVTASMNLWTGRESYFIDGRRIVRTHKWWGTRRFTVGEREPHEVVIRVTALAWFRVYIDGELFEDDLFPSARRMLQAGGALLMFLGLLACLVRFIPFVL